MEKKLTYGVWAVRSSTSIFGPAQSWCKENGKPLEFDTKADAENYGTFCLSNMVLKLEIQYSLHFMMETRKFLLRVLSWQVPIAVMIPF